MLQESSIVGPYRLLEKLGEGGMGHLVSAESLEWGATCLRPRGGKTVTTDGPYLETKEQVGGLIVIEARDLNEALRVAALHPFARVRRGSREP